MTDMEHAIEQAARVLDKAMDSAEWRWAEDPDDAPTLLARALAEEGLIAPAPLREITATAIDGHTYSRWATDWVPAEPEEP